MKICLADFLKTNLTKFAVIRVKRRQKADFLSPTEKLQNQSNEGKEKEEKRKKAMVALLAFIMATSGDVHVEANALLKRSKLVTP